MNSIERIRAAVEFTTTDRVPVFVQVFGHAAVLAGVPLHDYVRDGTLLARCQLRTLDQYGYDAVFVMMGSTVETEALGSTLTYWPDRYPVVRSYAYARGMNLDALSLPDPGQDGRMPELLKAVRILRHEVGDGILVVGCILGPMTLATQLLGIEETLYLAVDEPESLARLLDFAARVATHFGQAQLEAGAHLLLMFEPSASPAVVPWQFFREFVLPPIKEIFAALKVAGTVANWLHIAGPTASILPFYAEAGVDIANFDYGVTPEIAQEALPNTCLDGNIKPLSFVEELPEDIAAESLRLLDLFAERGGFILSSGCEIPLESRPENVAAMVMATRS